MTGNSPSEEPFLHSCSAIARSGTISQSMTIISIIILSVATGDPRRFVFYPSATAILRGRPPFERGARASCCFVSVSPRRDIRPLAHGKMFENELWRECTLSPGNSTRRVLYAKIGIRGRQTRTPGRREKLFVYFSHRPPTRRRRRRGHERKGTPKTLL